MVAEEVRALTATRLSEIVGLQVEEVEPVEIYVEVVLAPSPPPPQSPPPAPFVCPEEEAEVRSHEAPGLFTFSLLHSVPPRAWPCF